MHYRVSLIAAALRWVGYTTRRAVLVCSRDGFILWAKSSDTALKTGAYFKTSAGPIEVPATSLAATQDLLVDGKTGLKHDPGVWFPEPVREMTIHSEQYDFAVTLLTLEDRSGYQHQEEYQPDTFDVFMERG